jgi:hypothetical protein
MITKRLHNKRISIAKKDDRICVLLQAILPKKDLSFNGNGIRGNYKQTCFGLTEEAAIALYQCLQEVLERGSEKWQSEYDTCRVLLNELVALKELKDKEGKTNDYLFRQPIAWNQAKEFLRDYQHFK